MKTVVWGRNEKFIEFLKNVLSENEVYVASDFEEAADAAEDADSFFLLPDYDDGKDMITEFSDSEIKRLVSLKDSEKIKIYIENYSSINSRDACVTNCTVIAPVSPMARNSVRIKGELKEELGFELLQKRNGVFCPNNPEEKGEKVMLAEVRNCLGVHDVVAEDEICCGVALIKEKGFYTAMVDFTRFDGKFALPFVHWKKLYAAIYSEVTGVSPRVVEEAFEKSYSGIKTQNTSFHIRSNEERKKALEEGVLNVVKWHLESGILPNPDGSGGVYEMVRSFDLNIAKNIRGDSGLMTAALFTAAGKYFNNKEWEEISHNILNELLNNRSLQISEGVNKGLFKWFSGIGKCATFSVYISDTSRCANSLYAIYKHTGDNRLKELLMNTGEALLKWFDGDGLFGGGGCMDTDKWDLETIQTHKRNPAPEFYEAPMIFFKNIYDVTGDERYKNQIIKTADTLAKLHPTYGVSTAHSKNFTLSRALGVYAVGNIFNPDGYNEQTDDILSYFKELQHPCGGFADGAAYFDSSSLKKNMEFAIGFGPEHGNVCDLMYCHNTMLYVLNILIKSESLGFNKALAKEMFEKAVDFVLNVQIKSADKRLSGGWMRAFDMDLGEYYGCDKDIGWGPYSILAGWMTGAIPLVFLDILGMETMY